MTTLSKTTLREEFRDATSLAKDAPRIGWGICIQEDRYSASPIRTNWAGAPMNQSWLQELDGDPSCFTEGRMSSLSKAGYPLNQVVPACSHQVSSWHNGFQRSEGRTPSVMDLHDTGRVPAASDGFRRSSRFGPREPGNSQLGPREPGGSGFDPREPGASLLVAFDV